MPFSGSGTWTNVYNWVNDAAAGIKILASRQQTQWDDIANNGLSNVICKDGQSTVTANIPFSNFRLTGVGAPTTANDALIQTANTAWTPSDQSGAGLVLTNNGAGYTKVGTIVFAWANITFPATADGTSIKIGGLPFASSSANGVGGGFPVMGLSTDNAQFNRGTTTFNIYTQAGIARINSAYSAGTFYFMAIYPTA